MKFLLLHESAHIIFTAFLTLILYLKFKNWKLVVIAFLITLFLDADHIFDYSLYAIKVGKFTFPFATDYFHGSQKVYVLLHGWELAFPLWFLSKRIGKKNNIKGLEWFVVLPYLGHLLIDQLFYTPNPLGYSLIFRIITNFDIARFNSL